MLASQVIVSPSVSESVAFTSIASAATPSPFTAATSSALLSGDITSPEVISTGSSTSTELFVESATGPVVAQALLTVTLGFTLLTSVSPAV